MATQRHSFPTRTAPSFNWRAYIRKHWMYRAEGKRDLRLDFLRGLCIIIMVVDHIGGDSPLRVLTGGNTFFVSAAEGFVFISGLLLGEVYRKIVEREGFGAALRKALHRAWKLYLLTFVLTLGFGYGAWLIGSPWADRQELIHPARFAIRVLTLQRSYVFTDILVMYTLLIVGAPLALWLLHRRWTWSLLAGSWALWLLYQISPGDAGQPLPTIQSFHPAAWQIFFVHAMALGYHRKRVAAWFNALPQLRVFAVWLLLFAALLTLYIVGGALIDPLIPSDPDALLRNIFLKNPVRIGRILAALIVFPLVFLIVKYAWQPLRRAIGWLVLPLGQFSLYSYTMHLPLILLFAVIFRWPPGLTFGEQMLNSAIQSGAVLLLWLMIRRRLLFGVVPN